jgi:hypothetical protein
MTIKKLLLFLVIPALFCACNWDYDSSSSVFFNSNLRETWINNESFYDDELEITRDTITIKPDEWYRYGGDIPGLEGFIQDIPLEGYSEKLESKGSEHWGTLFIKQNRDLVEVPYSFWGPYGARVLTIGDDSDRKDKSKYTDFIIKVEDEWDY